MRARFLLLFVHFAILACYVCAQDLAISREEKSRDSVEETTLLQGYRILRCQFGEKRLVVQRDSKITILTENETLPGTRIRLVKIGGKQALFESQTRGTKEFILIEEKEGRPVVKRVSKESGIPRLVPSSESTIVLERSNNKERRK